jgi:predicted DNA-binding protein (MmcQ/YjbR family)
MCKSELPSFRVCISISSSFFDFGLPRKMNVELVQGYCLCFPHATENLQWGDNLCFKVGGKLFAVLSLSSVPQRLAFNCTAEGFAELVEREGIVPAPYVGRYSWVSLERLDVLPWPELKDLLEQSYWTVAAKAKIGIASKRKAQRPIPAGKKPGKKRG